LLARVFWSSALALLAAAQSGCSSDAVTGPEPELLTPGTFVASLGYDEPGAITLLRTLDRVELEADALLFCTVYDVHPSSWEEAREMAKSHDIPIRLLIRIEPIRVITDNPHQVVWFRTLTDEEEARIQ
jgi:hypothetical protein